MILVTGGRGFIGHHFVKHAMQHDDVVVLDSETYAGTHPVACPYVRTDINDFYSIRTLLVNYRPTACVHLAAESHVGRSIFEREVFVKTNVTGTANLLEALLGYADKIPLFRFLHVSTDEVYGSLGAEEKQWTEESPHRPNNPYAATKAASDMLVRGFVESYDFPAIITHCGNNYGSGQNAEKFIPTLISQKRAGKALTVHGDGMNVRDWIHVDDHVRGLWAALTEGQVGETYNFGGDCERTNLYVARLIGDRIEFVPDRPCNDRRYGINHEKATKLLNWSPLSRIEERIGELL